MTTVLTSPVYPVPTHEAQVIFTLTGTGANYVRVWVTIAPEGSELSGKLKKSTQNRFKVYEGDGGINNPFKFFPDKGGKYTFVAQEYTRGSGHGGGYQGDPNGATSETKVGSEATLLVFIGQKLTQKIGVSPDSATLELWVWDANIRKTTLATHGEVTPAITSTSPTPRAKAAMESATVTTALATLVDMVASTALGEPIDTIVANLAAEINGHIALGSTTHFAADADNGIKSSVSSKTSPKELPEFVNTALQLMRRHRLNDHGGTTTEPPGTESATYHKVGGQFRADYVNMPLYQGVGNLEDAYGALADIWRAHEGHRVNVDVHGSPDTTYALTALPAILRVHMQFLTVLASLSPDVPPAQSTGAMKLISQAGFTEV